MALGEHDAAAGKLLAILHAADARHIGLEVDKGALMHRPRALTGPRFIGANPEIEFGLMYDKLGIRVMRRAGIIDETVGVIGMDMRQEDMRDRGGIDAALAQILGQLAQR